MNSGNKRVLIIGSNGMLGQRLSQFFLSKKNIELFCASYEKQSVLENVQYYSIDIADEKSIQNVINEISPLVIINTAAYTAVDKAEIEKELCNKVNVEGVKFLARSAKQIEAHLINISTDYLFDGDKGPYTEDDEPNPVGYYGLSKLRGEKEILDSGCINTIIRTNVLYGPAKYGRMDFVKWVVNSLKEKKEISIVTDQINNPTYIDDLVGIIDSVTENRQTGIFNSGGREFLSRYEFTMRIADYFNLDKSLIKPVLTSALNQPAKRPLKSGLLIEKAKKELNYNPSEIEETFRLMKEELNL